MIKKTLFLIISITLAVNICAPSASGSSVADFLVEMANKCYIKGDWQGALQESRKALLVEPNHQGARRLIEQIEQAELAELKLEMERRKREQIEQQAREKAECLRRSIAEAEKRLAQEEQKRLELEKAKIEEEKVRLEQLAKMEIEGAEEEIVTPEISEKPVMPEPQRMPTPTEAEEEIASAEEEITSAWVKARPKEVVTSQELEQYRLFSEAEVVIDGQQLEIKPVIIKDNEVWLPLEEMTRALGLVVFSRGKDSLTVISAEGIPLEFNVGKKEALVNKKPFLTIPKPLAVYDSNFMLNLDSCQEALNIFCEYFPDTNVIKIATAKKEKFSTFTMAKPIAAIEEEERIKEMEEARRAEPLLPREVREELLPRKYYPDIDFKLDSTFKYYHDMFEDKRTRYIEHYLKGKMYGIDVYGHLSTRDYETEEKRTFQEDAQHLSFFKGGTGIKLLDNYMRLPGVRTQSQSYWGLELDYGGAPVRGNVWLGEMDSVYIPSAELGHSVRYSGNLYASRQDWIDTKQLRLSAVELFTHSDTEFSEESGYTDYPRRNFVYLLDSDWQIWPELNFYNSFAQCFYAPDNERDVIVSDFDFKSGMKFRGERFNLSSSFEFVGDKYASLGIPSTYQDYIGGDIAADFKIAENLTLNIAGNMNRDNVAFDEASPTSHTRGIYTNANLSLPWRQNLNFGYNYNRYLTRGGLQDASGSEYNSYRFDYYKTLEAASFQLGWQHYRMDPLASSTGSMFFDTYSATVYKSFPGLRGSYIRLYQDMTKRKSLAMGDLPTTSTWNTALSARYYLFSNLSLRGDCRVQTTQEQQADDTSVLSFSVGADYDLSPDTSLNCTYEASNIDLHDDWSTQDWSILFYVRHIFDFKTPEKWGSIMVNVFEDLNGNDIRDAEEKGLADVFAYVIKGRGAKTYSDGLSLIEQVVPGRREVRLDMRALPVDIVIKGDPTKKVMVEPLKISEVTFIAVTIGRIEGRIFVDTDNNGIFDKDVDIPIPNVRVFLSPEYKDTLSFSDGSYRFDYAYPGRCQVNIDLEWVPEEYKLVSPQMQDIEVKSKETVEDVDFLFKGRALKIKYF